MFHKTDINDVKFRAVLFQASIAGTHCEITEDLSSTLCQFTCQNYRGKRYYEYCKLSPLTVIKIYINVKSYSIIADAAMFVDYSPLGSSFIIRFRKTIHKHSFLGCLGTTCLMSKPE